MKINLIAVGEVREKYISEGIHLFEKRLEHYIPFEAIVISPLRANQGSDFRKLQNGEGEKILSKIKPGDFVVLLDELGKEFSSAGFSKFIDQKMNAGTKTICFIIGGAYGVSEEVRKKANLIVALSAMTFTHELSRLFFTEQLYRAMTILKNEKYHH